MFFVLSSFCPCGTWDIGGGSRSTKLQPLTGLFAAGADLLRRYSEEVCLTCATAPKCATTVKTSPTELPSLRDVGHRRRFPFYRASAPDGAIRGRCGFAQTVHPEGMSRRDNSSAEGQHLDGHHVPQGHKLGRDGISDRPPTPLQGRNMSRRDTSSVEGRHHDRHLVPQGHKLGRDGISDRPPNAPSGAKHVPQGHKLGRNGVPGRSPMPLQGRNLTSFPNCPGPDSGN